MLSLMLNCLRALSCVPNVVIDAELSSSLSCVPNVVIDGELSSSLSCVPNVVIDAELSSCFVVCTQCCH